ncbi:MAG: DUF1329 domain-containing protein, partial [Deltaproteobacteria bacterium]|nr:DUF1329 domain-containing protein [Deltaproteobacteria bacterium]
VEIYKDPEKWGSPPEGSYFHVVPYKQIIETKGMIAATKKYAPLVKTDAGGKILNYADIAGMPFPQPKTGRELAYNMECNTRGDTYKIRWWAPSIDPRHRTDRPADQIFEEMYFIHRTDVDPKPAFLKNPKGYHKGQFLHFILPPEMHNSRMIVMKFIDETVDYSSYLYYSEFRRIKRLSQAERTNAIDGTDMIYDDGNMWDGYLSHNESYDFKGKKELLTARNQDMKKVNRVAGQAQANGFEMERCPLYVVEVKHKDPNYIYKKRVWYLDPETYMIQYQDLYDQLGRYWKLMMQPTGDVKTANGEMKSFSVSYQMHDMQRTHSGFTRNDVQKISHNIKSRLFSLSNLQKSY